MTRGARARREGRDFEFFMKRGGTRAGTMMVATVVDGLGERNGRRGMMRVNMRV